MKIALVVAAARNNVIGRGGQMPWYIPSDFKWFKAVTMGKPVIMGRKTFDSIGKPLPGRTNIIVTGNREFKADGAGIAFSLEEALDVARALRPEEACVIGGGQIYADALPLADRIYLTKVDAAPDGDAFFPAIDKALWTVAEPDDAPEPSARDEFGRRFYILDRKPAS